MVWVKSRELNSDQRVFELSSPPNPFSESPPPGTAAQATNLQPASPVPPPAENPVWTGWDVLLIAVLMFLTPFLLLPLIFGVAHRLLFRGVPWSQLAQKPALALITQFLAYIAVLFCMVALVEGKYHVRFFQALGWNWPQPRNAQLRLAGLGFVLLFGLQGLAHFLPIPKSVPFDQFFQHPLDAYLTAIFAVSLGPFMEEVFFRGFLYPLLARRLGTVAAILLTALGFALLHAMQLGFAWGAVFIIFIVGVTLTVVRAVTHSVAASFLVHVAYNSTLMILTFVATGGFRHLERLNP